MELKPMIHTAEALVAPGKGVLAADESTPTMAKRLAVSVWSRPSGGAGRTAKSFSRPRGLASRSAE